MKYKTIGIFAHIDSGKTTLTERLLFEAGKIKAMGSIEDGTTESDDLREEIVRGISIRSSFHTFDWIFNNESFRIQIIDTPGHIDFRNQVSDLLPMVEIAILVLEAGAPVQSQARLVLEELRHFQIPTLFFINKLDRFGDEYLETLVSLEEILAKSPTILFQNGPNGYLPFWKHPQAFSESVVEDLVSWNDSLLEEFWSAKDKALPIATKGFAEGVRTGSFIPVLGGSAKTGLGVRDLLEAICLVNPKEATEDQLWVLARREYETWGKILILYANGSLRLPDSRYQNFQFIDPVSGGKLEFVDAGQLVYATAPKADRYLPGYPIAPSSDLRLPEAPVFRPFSLLLEGESQEDTAFFAEKLSHLVWEDPGYSYLLQEDTGQILLSGLGELHLDIALKRISESTEKKSQSSEIRIARLELLKKMSHKVALEHRAFEDQRSSGVLVAVLEDTASFTKRIAFEVSLPEEVKQFIETSFLEACEQGPLGREVVGVSCRVLSYTAPEAGFASALPLLKVAVQAGLKECFLSQTQLIGPLTELEVHLDAEHLGVVLSDLSRRDAKVYSIEEAVAGKSRLKASAPAQNLLGFSGALRNMTKGIGISWERTAFTSEFYAVLKE